MEGDIFFFIFTLLLAICYQDVYKRQVYETALLSGSEQVLVSLFRELHPDQQKELIEFIRFKLHENNTGKEKN